MAPISFVCSERGFGESFNFPLCVPFRLQLSLRLDLRLQNGFKISFCGRHLTFCNGVARVSSLICVAVRISM
uniref:Uncharacterized protein n=1 Tax=Anguilla anguilla TaxID=7936 RepID=A0A0E9XNT3_ANGAN